MWNKIVVVVVISLFCFVCFLGKIIGTRIVVKRYGTVVIQQYKVNVVRFSMTELFRPISFLQTRKTV